MTESGRLKVITGLCPSPHSKPARRSKFSEFIILKKQKNNNFSCLFVEAVTVCKKKKKKAKGKGKVKGGKKERKETKSTPAFRRSGLCFSFHFLPGTANEINCN